MIIYSHQYFHLKDPGRLPQLTRLWRRSASSWYAASCCFHCFTLAVDSSRAAVSLALFPLSVASSASQCLLIVELHRQNQNGQRPQTSACLFFFSLKHLIFFFSKYPGRIELCKNPTTECPNENLDAQTIKTMYSANTDVSLLENNLYPPSSTEYFLIKY